MSQGPGIVLRVKTPDPDLDAPRGFAARVSADLAEVLLAELRVGLTRSAAATHSPLGVVADLVATNDLSGAPRDGVEVGVDDLLAAMSELVGRAVGEQRSRTAAGTVQHARGALWAFGQIRAAQRRLPMQQQLQHQDEARISALKESPDSGSA